MSDADTILALKALLKSEDYYRAKPHKAIADIVEVVRYLDGYGPCIFCGERVELEESHVC